MKIHFGILLAALAIAAGCAARASAQDSVPLESLSNGALPAETRPTASQPVDDMGSLLLERPPVPVTTARFLLLPKAKPKEEIVEGTTWIERRCRLDKDPQTKWYCLRFEGDTDPRPKLVAPSPLLEQMIALEAAKKGRVFRASCETTLYKGTIYVVLSRLTVESDTASAPAEKITPPASQASVVAGTTSLPASQPVMRSNIAAKLLRERPAKPVLIPVAPSHEGEITGDSVAPGEQKQIFSAKGSMVVDRLVRVASEPGNAWKMVRFESDNTLQEPPIRLLPCKMLERAESFLTPQSRYRKLVISGELLEFQGHRYLLLRKVLPFREMGQF